MKEVLETAANIAKKSSMVRIDNQALRRFALKLIDDGIEVPSWDPLHHFSDNSEVTVSYLLVLDSLNFCFWPPPGKARWAVQHKSDLLSGYYAMAASLKKAVRSGIAITDADYLARLPLGELKQVLGDRGELQLLDYRVQILNELGQVLLKDYEGKSHKLVDAAGRSAIRLVRLLAEKLSSFADIAEYQGYTESNKAVIADP